MSSTDNYSDFAPHGPEEKMGHGSKPSYLVGFALSAILTAIPFWLVMANPIGHAGVTAAAVVAMAVLQILVHTVCFLHVNNRTEGGWTLLAYIFTGVIVLITITGSLWIMYHLNTNMMPGMMSGTQGSMP